MRNKKWRIVAKWTVSTALSDFKCTFISWILKWFGSNRLGMALWLLLSDLSSEMKPHRRHSSRRCHCFSSFLCFKFAIKTKQHNARARRNDALNFIAFEIWLTSWNIILDEMDTSHFHDSFHRPGVWLLNRPSILQQKETKPCLIMKRESLRVETIITVQYVTDKRSPSSQKPSCTVR